MRATIRKLRRAGVDYDALGKAQEILDRAYESGAFAGKTAETAIARAERLLGMEFCDVDVVVDEDRLIARERWTTRWVEQEAI